MRTTVRWLMIGFASVFGLLVLWLYAVPYYEYWFGFKQQEWLLHASIPDCTPRRSMVPDLMLHYLPVGTARQYVVTLLGTPYKEEKQVVPQPAQRLSFRCIQSDSLPKAPSATLVPAPPLLSADFKPVYTQVSTLQDTLLRYPISLNVSDPDFLVIHLSPQGRVVRYHIQSH